MLLIDMSLRTKRNSFVPYVGSTDNKAFIARKGETIDATIESHIYQVRLKDSLLSSLTFGRARDAEVAWIDSRLTYQVIYPLYLLNSSLNGFVFGNRLKI